MPESTFDAALRVAKTNGATNQLQGQDDQTFLFLILKALSTCAQDQWDALGVSHPKAHKWYEVAAEANNHQPTPLPIPFPDGFKPVKLSAPPPKPVVTVKQPEPVVAALASPPKELRKEKEKRSKNSGILDAIRKTIILNQTWNAKQVHEYIVKNGFPDASHAIVAVNTGDVKRVLALVRELGFWKDADAEKKTA